MALHNARVFVSHASHGYHHLINSGDLWRTGGFGTKSGASLAKPAWSAIAIFSSRCTSSGHSEAGPADSAPP
eukprot:scaffold1584_cov259-Pinguiococcus_pyrenoidosus.AAC.7